MTSASLRALVYATHPRTTSVARIDWLLLSASLLIVIGVLMVSGIWSIWMYELQAVITGFVPAI